jgi:cobalt-zinc-cadmium efflux system protein
LKLPTWSAILKPAAVEGDGMEDGGRKVRLWVALLGGAAVMVAEVVTGLAANSLVLLADAAHYATDVAAVGLALLAVVWSEKAATRSKSFGYRRSEVVAAFLNAVALWVLSGYFVVEAVRRLRAPPEVDGPIVLAMGTAALVVNIVLAALLHRDSRKDLNLKAAYLHILSDVLGSAAAVAAGLAVLLWDLHIADPLLTLFIAVLILAFTWRLTRQTLHILMEGTPHHLDAADVERTLRALPGIADIHDLHVWTISHGAESLTAHVVAAGGADGEELLRSVHRVLAEKYGLRHSTIQVERAGWTCEQRH